MTSGYHLEVAEHYEKFPYPDYPLFSLGFWSELRSVDCSTWGASHEIRKIWIAGCGTIAPLMFARRNYNANIFGTDISGTALRLCQKRLQLFGMRNVLLKKEDLFDARYSAEFDAIDAYGVIHHTIAPQKSLEILAAALKTGGILRAMVYGANARAEIEDLRKSARDKKIQTVEEAKDFLKAAQTRLSGDLKNSMGIADAILNPIVHVYTRESLDGLFSSVSSLKVTQVEECGNFLVFAKKI